jgi:hypothetical protein
MSMLLNFRRVVRRHIGLLSMAAISLAASGCTSSERGLSSQQSKATIKQAASDPFPTADAAGIKKESESKDSKKSSS